MTQILLPARRHNQPDLHIISSFVVYVYSVSTSTKVSRRKNSQSLFEGYRCQHRHCHYILAPLGRPTAPHPAAGDCSGAP